jgi:hypothetical protein
MGLDLCCQGFDGLKMGSYSTVQQIRKHWIQAYIEYLKSINKPTQALENTILFKGIDYDKFDNLRCYEEGFHGLNAFVNHSDCEDIWTFEEIKEILETLQLVKTFLKPITFDWHFVSDTQYYLEEMFEYAVKQEEDIYFC